MHDLCHIFMIEKTRTATNHPRGKGQLERFSKVIFSFRNIVLENIIKNGMCSCLVLLLCITPMFMTRATMCSTILGREARCPIDLLLSKPPGDLRLKLGYYAEEMNERLYRIHRQAQFTTGTKKRQQRGSKSKWRTVRRRRPK